MENTPDKSTSDYRSPTARAAAWSSRILTVSLMMVLPGVAGLWVDRQLGTVALFMLSGFALGGYGAMVQLLRMTRTIKKTSKQRKAAKKKTDKQKPDKTPDKSPPEDPSFPDLPEIEFPTRNDP